MHSDCTNCPYRSKCISKACVKETRNVIDVVVETRVVAHKQLCVKECPLSGTSKEGSFPKNVKANVQYGENLQSLAVAFNTVGAVSVSRIHDILSGVFDIPLSTGTIKNMGTRCAEKIKPALATIQYKLLDSYLVHCDEAGTKIDGKLHWVHNVSNSQYTYMAISKKRGYEGINAVSTIPYYHGTIVHDCRESYWRFDNVRHSACCAHLLRELNGIIENHPEQTWAIYFKALLLQMKKSKDRAISANKDFLSAQTIKKYENEYDRIIELAYLENSVKKSTQKKRGRVKRGKILSLIDRLAKHKASVCLFLNDFYIPFDNNQAERDIRNIKTKTKVCGCFKSFDGASEYMNIMSFISTAHKQGYTTYEAIKLALTNRSESILA